ncbi:MAG: PH domain-containing protein [Coriobacteriia bacterium]
MTSPVLVSFKPSRSYGWLWLVGLTALVAVSALPLVMPEVVPPEERAALWIGLAIMVPLLAYLLVTLASLPAMRYDLTTDELVLSCGPLMRYRIPYTQITDVRRTTLTPTLWSSMRMPGLAIGGVLYADTGNVKMCATRMSRDILLVTAGKRRYGLTPADEAAFMAALAPLLPRVPSGVS